MSRIGKLPMEIPSDVDVTIEGEKISVKGSKGTLNFLVHKKIKILKEDNKIILERSSDSSFDKSLHGLTRTLINNMLIGVAEGFQKELEISGIGYRAAVQGNNLVLSLGYSNPINYRIPEGISFEVDKNRLTVKGIDKELVGRVAAEIRSFRKIEPYKGKGVKYLNERIKRKVGKTS